MRPRDPRALLHDAARATELIGRFTDGRALEDYSADEMLRSAVERQFEIIGEALARARAMDPSLAERLPHLDRIVSFRNRLAHAYATIADEVVWGIVESHLPALARAVRAALDDIAR